MKFIVVLINHYLLAFLSICLLLTCLSTAEAQIPDAVLKSFKNKYPNEKVHDWEKDAHNYIEIQFKKDGDQYRADFLNDGTWIETEVSIDKDDLPKAIKKIIKETYGDRKIAEIEKVEHHSKGIFYDVEFKKKGKNLDVEFRANGEIIN